MIPFPAAERNDTRNGSYIMLKHTILPYGNFCPRGYMQKDNIIAHQLLASRRFSLLTAEAGILTSLLHPDTFPPELQKGQWLFARKEIMELTAAGQLETYTPFPFQRVIGAPPLFNQHQNHSMLIRLQMYIIFLKRQRFLII